MSVAGDGLRLGLGTLTVLPVGAPAEVDRRRAAVAMLVAPVAGVVVGLVAGGAAALAAAGHLPVLVCGGLAVGAGALATRFLHLDGLADTADGLAAAAHGQRDRALEVMRRGDVGPVGVTVLVVVLLVQATAAGTLTAQHGPVTGGLAVAWSWAVSRAVLPLLCSPAFRPARPDGLGAAVIGAVPPVLAVPVASAVAAAGLLVGVVPAVGALVALAVVSLAAGAVARRLGGLTGDTLGAGVEVVAAVVLVMLTAPAVWPLPR